MSNTNNFLAAGSGESVTHEPCFLVLRLRVCTLYRYGIRKCSSFDAPGRTERRAFVRTGFSSVAVGGVSLLQAYCCPFFRVMVADASGARKGSLAWHFPVELGVEGSESSRMRGESLPA
jgi:hypothetical protein